MDADDEPGSRRRGDRQLLVDIRRLQDLQRERRGSPRQRVEAALGAELASCLLGALTPRRPR